MFATVGCHLEAHACIFQVLHEVVWLSLDVSADCCVIHKQWMSDNYRANMGLCFFRKNVSVHRFKCHFGNNRSRLHRFRFVLCSFTVVAAVKTIISEVDLLALNHNNGDSVYTYSQFVVNKTSK